MQFAVLGSLRVAGDGGEPVAVTAARLRVLLAVLLWRANQPVPADELAELVWDGAPPADAAGAARTLVKRLRRVLGEPTGERVITRAPGWMIELSEDELDVSRFEALSRAAGAAVRAGRWAEAAPAAAAALGLWRGPPLADVSSRALRDRWVPRLELARVQVLEWRIEADLHEGRHKELIGELREVAGCYPLREGFHGLLMLALARAGRQAEALAAYRNARRVLIAELGIEPGPELRRLHEQILAGDATLLTPPPAHGAAPTGSAAAVVPRQLPAAARVFVGRQAEFTTLAGVLGETGAGGAVVISVIGGMAGVGKAALAVQAAHQLAGKFPDGQLFIDLHGYTQGSQPRSAGEALAAFLRALGVPPQQVPADTEERAALFRQRVADTRTLIVLDNAASEAQVRPLLPGSARCLVLVTSRRRLKGLDDTHVLSLDVLEHADALALLRAVAGPERAAADDPALGEIAGLCGRLPLALRIAAALLRHRPAWTLEYLAGLLRDQWQRISALSDGDRDLCAVFDLSYQSLPMAQRQLFRHLGLIPGPDFDTYAAAALMGASQAAAARLLESLTDHNLLLQHAPDRYSLHDLIRLHARALAARDPAFTRSAALDRLLDYYQHTAGRANALITPSPQPVPSGPAPAHAPVLQDPGAAWMWLRAERPNLLAAVQHAADHAQPRRTIALTADLAPLLHADGPGSQAIALHTAAASIAGALGDQRSQASALTELAHARRITSGIHGAVGELERALEIYTSLGDRQGQAHTLTGLVMVQLQLTGACHGLARDLERAFEIYADIGELNGQAQVLTIRGQVQLSAGNLQDAASNLEKALDMFRQLGSRGNEAWAQNVYAAVIAATGDHARARNLYRHILHLARETNQPDEKARALEGVGECHLRAGNVQTGIVHLEQALTIFQRVDMKPDADRVLARLTELQRHPVTRYRCPWAP